MTLLNAPRSLYNQYPRQFWLMIAGVVIATAGGKLSLRLIGSFLNADFAIGPAVGGFLTARSYNRAFISSSTGFLTYSLLSAARTAPQPQPSA